MNKFLLTIQSKTEAYLTVRKARKAYQIAVKKPRTFVGELLSWLDALLFAIVVVILINQYLFQLFVIPSPSMVHTLEIGDRVFVGKNSYGLELYSAGKKVGTKNRVVHRDNIITFYNPEYPNKGVFFNVLSQFIYSGTFTLVNIDRNEDGSVAERLLVKRAVGFPEEVVRFHEGNVKIRKAGSTAFEDEIPFRTENDLSRAPFRSLDADQYDGIEAWGALYAYQELGVKTVPAYLSSAYSNLTNTRYPEDMYQFEASRTRTKALFNPTDFSARSASRAYQEGIYVGKGQVLPLGDNRDDSRDGRYFGPVWQKNVNGRVLFRFWPLSRISYLGNA
jgi:signal peptidase I